MFDPPVVVVKASALDFFDENLLKFSNNRVYSGARSAVQFLEDQPADVVITEMDVGEITGIELAEAVRTDTIIAHHIKLE